MVYKGENERVRRYDGILQRNRIIRKNDNLKNQIKTSRSELKTARAERTETTMNNYAEF